MRAEQIRHIRVSWTPDGLWGTEDPEQWDYRKWEARHEEILHRMLQEDYPGATIEIVRGNQRTTVNRREGTNEVHVIRSIEATAYEQWLDELSEGD